MKIIIPGGAGFVGKNLLELMLESGYEPEDIFVIDKNEDGIKFISRFGVNAIKADISKKGNWVDYFRNSDIVINLAAQISSENYDDFKKNNVDSVKNIIFAMKKNRVKNIIHFSSAAVLSVRKDWYAETKKKGEDIVLKSGLTYAIVRPSMMYGPYDDKNMGWFANFAMKIPIFPIPGNGKHPRQPVYIGDMCEIILKMIKKFPRNKIYNINGKEIVYYDEMIGEILKNLGGFRTKLYIPLPLFKFAVKLYRKLNPSFKFTTDQLDSLVSGDIFPEYPWWDEFKVNPTKFSFGVKKMFDKGIPKIKTII